MANTTITALPAATTPLTGTEVVPIVQSGTTKKVAVSNLISLTTTGTSGAATFVNSVLNIPQYSGGGGSGTVTSVGISAPAFLSVGGSPVTSSGTLALTYSGTALPVANGGTGQTSANAALNGLLPSQSGQSGKVLSSDGTNTTWTAVTGTGTVTSVGLSAPAFLTVSGSPVTASGTLALSYSGTAIPVANGGTGQTTATAAFDGLAPSQTGNSGKYLTTNGSTTSWATVSGGGSPAGSDTQVQYNSGGTSFGASSAFTFTSATGVVTATGFAGALNGTVGAATPTTGIFTTATARSSAVQDFVALQGRAGGTNSYGVTLTPTTLTASRTVTLPDANINFATGLPVANGGTGLTAGTSGGVPYFSGASAISSSAALTANALIVGGGAGAAPAPLASLGTATTVLHGNASGAPTFGAVSLSADVTGNLPVTNLNNGTSASSTTFWRGDGTWATPAGGGGGGPILESYITISQNYTITTGSNGLSAGPVAVATGYAVTIPSGQTWTVLA
jgi:hypothetical protein